MKLDVVDDELVACVACGLCLPHCPTYRVTGEESASPRGRIAAMRAVHFDDAPVDESFTSFMSLCVECRGCEAACPSGVPFGRLMEGARSAAVPVPWWQRLGFRVLGRHRLLVAVSFVLALLQRVRLVPPRLGVPRIPLWRPPLATSGDDVWLFTGCVMDAWMRPTHLAVKRVLEAAGFGVAVPDTSAAPCCGALHAHAGMVVEGRALAERTLRAFPGDAPILVDSAGCGAQLKEHSARVLDVHEFLAAHADRLPAPPGGRRFPSTVAVQDPCHLRHVQKAHLHVRTVLAPYADLAELDDEGLCCGAGGAYAPLHPEMAAAVRDRKLAAIARTGAPVVASANPGCAMHLGAAGVDVRHPLEIVDEVLHGR